MQQHREKIRTEAQNRALHLYCTQVADALNAAGLDVRESIQHRVSIPWTPALVKELVWRTIQRRLVGKESTTELDAHGEITAIWEVANRWLAELKVESIPFPSLESAMDRGVHIRE